MKVTELMTPDPACCLPQTKLTDVARMMAENNCGEIPVIGSREDRRPIGVVTDRDIVLRTLGAGVDPMQKTAADCMTEPCITVTPETTLVECCDVMEQNQIRRVPVIDDGGRLIGIVALADVTKYAGRRTTAEVIKEVSEQRDAKPH